MDYYMITLAVPAENLGEADDIAAHTSEDLSREAPEEYPTLVMFVGGLSLQDQKSSINRMRYEMLTKQEEKK